MGTQMIALHSVKFIPISREEDVKKIGQTLEVYVCLVHHYSDFFQI